MFSFLTALTNLLWASVPLIGGCAASYQEGPIFQPNKTCTVPASGTNATDDAPAIVQAFQECGHGGKIVFSNTTYYVNSFMNTTGLDNCEIDIQGTLLVSHIIQCLIARTLNMASMASELICL